MRKFFIELMIFKNFYILLNLFPFLNNFNEVFSEYKSNCLRLTVDESLQDILPL